MRDRPPRGPIGPVTAASMLALLMEQPAEAYVDPGAGSMLLQLVLGGVMAGLVFMRSGLRRVRHWFRRYGRSSREE